MYTNLVKDLAKIYGTEFKVVTEDINSGDYRDKVSISVEGTRLSLLIKDKILSDNERELVKLMLRTTYESSASYKSLLEEEYAYRSFTRELKFPFKIWEIRSEKQIEGVSEFISLAFPDEVRFQKDDKSLVIFKGNGDPDSVRPGDLFYEIEREQLTDVEIFVSYEIDSPADIYTAYEDLANLRESTAVVESRNSVFEYDKYLLPNLMYTVRNSDGFKKMESFFKKNDIGLDEELFSTALVFLENNLNITDAADKLYIHRNTLIYRLNKIETVSGYDIRKFNDAINFYICIIVKELKK